MFKTIFIIAWSCRDSRIFMEECWNADSFLINCLISVMWTGTLILDTHVKTTDTNSLSIISQFEKDIVDICFEILDNSPTALKNPEMDTLNRTSPVYVSRTITAMVSLPFHTDSNMNLWLPWPLLLSTMMRVWRILDIAHGFVLVKNICVHAWEFFPRLLKRRRT